MKKKIILIASIAVVAVLLAVLAIVFLGERPCEHDWKNADCENPQICKVCSQTQGQALGHKWEAATCEKAKTCSVCGLSEGEKADHQWQPASTEAPKTCQICKATEGEPLPGVSFDAEAAASLIGNWYTDMDGMIQLTFTNDGKWIYAAGKNGEVTVENRVYYVDGTDLYYGESYSSNMTKVEFFFEDSIGSQMLYIRDETVTGYARGRGEDDRFDLAAAAQLVGSWECNYSMNAGEMMDTTLPGSEVEIHITMRFTFDEYGRYHSVTLFDEESYRSAMRQMSIEITYQEYENMGYNRTQADAFFMSYYGMTIPGYVDMMLDQTIMTELEQKLDGVYYVADGKLYDALSWKDEMESSSLSFENGNMLLTDPDAKITLTFSKVAA